MFFDVITEQNLSAIPDRSNISIFLQEHKDIQKNCLKYTKFIIFLLTSPQTVLVRTHCRKIVFERKRQKTYLRSTSTQQRTNILALLKHNREIANEIDLDAIADSLNSWYSK